MLPFSSMPPNETGASSGLGERSTCYPELFDNALAAAGQPSSLHVSLLCELRDWPNKQLSFESTPEAAKVALSICTESFYKYLNPGTHKIELYSRSFDKPNHNTLLESSQGKMLHVLEEAKGTYFFRTRYGRLHSIKCKPQTARPDKRARGGVPSVFYDLQDGLFLLCLIASLTQIAKQQHKLRQKDLKKQLIQICRTYLDDRCDVFQDQKELFETFQRKLMSLQANLEVGLQLVLKFWQHFGRHIEGGEYVELCGELLDWLLPSQLGAARQDESGERTTSTTNSAAAHVSQLGNVTPTRRGATHSHSADQLTASTERTHGHTPARHNSCWSNGCANAQQEDSMHSQQTCLCSNSAPREPPAQGVHDSDGLLDQIFNGLFEQSESGERVAEANVSLLQLSLVPEDQLFRGGSQSHQEASLQSPALCNNLESIDSGQDSMLGHPQSQMHTQAVQQQHVFPLNQRGSVQASLPAEFQACRQPAGLGAGLRQGRAAPAGLTHQPFGVGQGIAPPKYGCLSMAGAGIQAPLLHQYATPVTLLPPSIAQAAPGHLPSSQSGQVNKAGHFTSQPDAQKKLSPYSPQMSLPADREQAAQDTGTRQLEKGFAQMSDEQQGAYITRLQKIRQQRNAQVPVSAGTTSAAEARHCEEPRTLSAGLGTNAVMHLPQRDSLPRENMSIGADHFGKHDRPTEGLMEALRAFHLPTRSMFPDGERAVPAEDERSQALATEAQDPEANAQAPHELQNKCAVDREGGVSLSPLTDRAAAPHPQKVPRTWGLSLVAVSSELAVQPLGFLTQIPSQGNMHASTSGLCAGAHQSTHNHMDAQLQPSGSTPSLPQDATYWSRPIMQTQSSQGSDRCHADKERQIPSIRPSVSQKRTALSVNQVSRSQHGYGSFDQSPAKKQKGCAANMAGAVVAGQADVTDASSPRIDLGGSKLQPYAHVCGCFGQAVDPTSPNMQLAPSEPKAASPSFRSSDFSLLQDLIKMGDACPQSSDKNNSQSTDQEIMSGLENQQPPEERCQAASITAAPALACSSTSMPGSPDKAAARQDQDSSSDQPGLPSAVQEASAARMAVGSSTECTSHPGVASLSPVRRMRHYWSKIGLWLCPETSIVMKLAGE